MSFKKWKSFIFSDYEIDQFRKPEAGPGSIPHTKEEAKKSGMNENEWRNEGQTQPQDDKPYWAKVNVSRMSPKLLRPQPHIVKNRGITVAPLFLRLIS